MPPPPPPEDAQAPPGLIGAPGSVMEYQDFSFDMFLSSLFIMFKDCLFYGGLIQFIVVVYMYIRIGKGKTWKIFLISAIALFIAQVAEHVLMVLTFYKQTYKIAYFCYIPVEIFFIISGYSIPYINYLKLKAISRGNYMKMIKILLIAVFPIYCCLRILIGYFRFKDKDINPASSRNIKGASGSVVASLDFLISILMIYELKKNLSMERLQNKYLSRTSIYSYIRKSNYAVLLLIDLIGFCLSFTSYTYVAEKYMDLVIPFQCIQDNFIMILAIDALIFKVDCFKMLSNGKSIGQSSFSTSTNNMGYSSTTMNKSYNGTNSSNYGTNYNGMGSNYPSINNNTLNYPKTENTYDYTKPLFSKNNNPAKPIVNDFGMFNSTHSLNNYENLNDNNNYTSNSKSYYSMKY